MEKYVVNCQVCGNPVHSLIWYTYVLLGIGHMQ